jgi:hypothetical protein
MVALETVIDLVVLLGPLAEMGEAIFWGLQLDQKRTFKQASISHDPSISGTSFIRE